MHNELLVVVLPFCRLYAEKFRVAPGFLALYSALMQRVNKVTSFHWSCTNFIFDQCALSYTVY